MSFAAPTKLDPLSVNISCGSPRLEMNYLRAARNASVVRSETGSRCAVFVEKQTNTHT